MLQNEYKPNDGEFRPFPKLYRLTRECIVTEKIDGTNAQVFVSTTKFPHSLCGIADVVDEGATWYVSAGSRNRWLSREKDNFGFAEWVYNNAEELATGLGCGYHYGEWWGNGIQRGYGLNEKRFSLFNTERWTETRPKCCHVVPVLATLDRLDWTKVYQLTFELLAKGSVAAPGFKEPEGVVVYHKQSNFLFKMTNKDEHKGTS